MAEGSDRLAEVSANRTREGGERGELQDFSCGEATRIPAAAVETSRASFARSGSHLPIGPAGQREVHTPLRHGPLFPELGSASPAEMNVDVSRDASARCAAYQGNGRAVRTQVSRPHSGLELAVAELFGKGSR